MTTLTLNKDPLTLLLSQYLDVDREELTPQHRSTIRHYYNKHQRFNDNIKKMMMNAAKVTAGYINNVPTELDVTEVTRFCESLICNKVIPGDKYWGHNCFAFKVYPGSSNLHATVVVVDKLSTLLARYESGDLKAYLQNLGLHNPDSSKDSRLILENTVR